MAVQISGNDITVPRDGSFTRNVTIGGTLTYEDVTNIDSVGLVTARTGIEIGARPGVAASISVDGNAEFAGIVTATQFVGNGANLTGIAATDNVRTSISYDDEEGIWILNARDSNMTGISRASHASFTLGKHNWTIKGDQGCSTDESYTKELKMSGCQEGNFTCNDGQCVSIDLRCNQFPECRDESDEMNCDILVLKGGYNKKVPPVNSSDPVGVSVSIDLLRLVDINEEDYSIEIQFEITLMWKEKRATYQNLKQRDSLNTLSKKDIGTLWLPKVIYENTDQKETTRLGSNWEWETRVVVRREQLQGRMSGLESVDETEIFSGFENSLVMNQTYTYAFQCNYKLSYYPFDTQVLP